MKKLRMKFANGDVMELGVPPGADSCCPICGEAFYHGYMPYDTDNGGFCIGSFDTCPLCEFLFGYSDVVGSKAPPGTVAEVWNDFRVRWLNRKGWAAGFVTQMKMNLGIDVAALRKQAGENISRTSLRQDECQPMAGNKIKLETGEIVDAKTLEAGAWMCPVCGAKLYSAWSLGAHDAGNVRGRFDTCPSCEFVPGQSDATSDEPPGTIERIREELRMRWLRQNNWDAESLAQLRNLGIDVEKLKREKGR